MNPFISISFSILLICLSINGLTDWSKFDGYGIYPTIDKSNCIFPFTYQNKNFTDCTNEGDNGNLPWCSLTPQYEGKFTYCYDFFKSTLQCLPTFTINGKTYTQCDYLSRTAKYKQCKTNHPTITYKYCIEQHVKKSGRPLARRDTCDPAYKKLSEDHTVCFGPSDHAIQIPINETEKQQILDMHNAYRSNVSASYMFKLYWDDELAKLAQAHSDMCAFDHDLSENRLTSKFGWKNGQNMVMSTEIRTSLASLLDMMFGSEKSNFIYGTGCTGGGGTCLHYTQTMLSNMTRVGCAHTHCLFPDRIQRFLTCNYIHSQYTNNFMAPYEQSATPGSKCPTKLVGNLCDCGNIICNYDGHQYIDPATCTCATTKPSKRDVQEEDTENREPFVFIPGSSGLVEKHGKSGGKKSHHKRGVQEEDTENGEPFVFIPESSGLVEKLGKSGGNKPRHRRDVNDDADGEDYNAFIKDSFKNLHGRHIGKENKGRHKRGTRKPIRISYPKH